MSTEQPKHVAEPILPAEEPVVRNDKRIRSIMMWCSILLAAIVVGTIAYIYGYRQPGNDAIGAADSEMIMGNDSVALAMYEQVAADHGFAAGNRAALQAAIILYDKGEYEKALGYLGDFSTSDEVIGACAEGLKGDCLANLDRLADASKAFKSAISKADGNPVLTPYFLTKRAHILEAMGEYADAAAAYKTVETEYPNFGRQTAAESHRLKAESLAK